MTLRPRNVVRTLAAPGIVFACAVALGACESTQAQSARLEDEGAKLLKNEKGVSVTKENPQVEVVESVVIDDPDGQAVVVTLKNLSQQGLAKLPIAIDVRDAKGKSIFKNDAPGLDPALNTVPVVGPGETVDWVHDQILPPKGGTGTDVKVQVGLSDTTYPAQVPVIEIEEGKLAEDVTGAFQVGKADTEGVVQLDLTFFGVARRDGEIVAAGRAGIKRLPPPSGRAQEFNIYFKGDAEGADISVTAPPSTLE